MSETSDESICGSTETSTGDPCENDAGWGVPNAESGACMHHRSKGGAPAGNQNAKGNDGGAPSGNLNAGSHLLRADPANVLEDIRENDEKAYAWIQDKFESYLSQASFGRDSAWADQLLQTVVREYTIWTSTGLQLEEGVVKQTTRTTDSGPIQVEDEHAVNRALNRMEKTVTKRYEKLGVMPSPEQQEADALAELKQAMRDDIKNTN